MTVEAYVGPLHARKEAGVWWRVGLLPGTREPAAWCPRCASATCESARQSYEDTGLDVESVMSEFWRAPTGRAVVPGNTVAKAHPGRVPPKAPPPGISSLATEERLAALEEEVARLRRRVAELEGHSSGAATSSAPPNRELNTEVPREWSYIPSIQQLLMF